MSSLEISRQIAELHAAQDAEAQRIAFEQGHAQEMPAISAAIAKVTQGLPWLPGHPRDVYIGKPGDGDTRPDHSAILPPLDRE